MKIFVISKDTQPEAVQDMSIDAVVRLASNANTQAISSIPCDRDTVTLGNCQSHVFSYLPAHIQIINVDDSTRTDTISKIPAHFEVLGDCFLLTVGAARAIPAHIKRIIDLRCATHEVYDALDQRFKCEHKDAALPENQGKFSRENCVEGASLEMQRFYGSSLIGLVFPRQGFVPSFYAGIPDTYTKRMR